MPEVPWLESASAVAQHCKFESDKNLGVWSYIEVSSSYFCCPTLSLPEAILAAFDMTHSNQWPSCGWSSCIVGYLWQERQSLVKSWTMATLSFALHLVLEPTWLDLTKRVLTDWKPDSTHMGTGWHVARPVRDYIQNPSRQHTNKNTTVAFTPQIHTNSPLSWLNTSTLTYHLMALHPFILELLLCL